MSSAATDAMAIGPRMNRLREDLPWAVGVAAALLLCAPFIPIVSLACAVRRIHDLMG